MQRNYSHIDTIKGFAPLGVNTCRGAYKHLR